jgi:hypothetical protein
MWRWFQREARRRATGKKKNGTFCAVFKYKSDHFTKTGSGQT